jgi:hypothetical protein
MKNISPESKWKDRKPTQLEIDTMIRMLRDSGFGIAADLIESLLNKES